MIQKTLPFYKVFKNEYPQYHSSHTSRNVRIIPIFNVKQSFFKNSLFPSTISEWNKMDPGIRNSESLSVFRKNILRFIRPAPNSNCFNSKIINYNCNNPKGVKLKTRRRLGLSHLRHDVDLG